MRSELQKFVLDKNNIDLLFEYASNPDTEIELPPKVKEEYDDICLLDKWMAHYKSKRMVISLFLKRKKDQDPEGRGVHMATAYRRFDLMERVFGPLNKSSKEYKRVFLEEWYTQLLLKMERSGQWKSIPAMAKVLADISDLKGSDEIPLDALLNPVPLIVGDFPELVGERMTKEEAEKFREKLQLRRETEIEDIDFVEVDRNGD